MLPEEEKISATTYRYSEQAVRLAPRIRREIHQPTDTNEIATRVHDDHNDA